MIIVHVEHFLNSEGQRIFPEWIREAAETLQNFEGFISIQQLISIDNSDESHLLLEFENLELLRKWSSNQVHDDLIEKLAPYRKKEQCSKIFRSEQKLTVLSKIDK